MPRGGLAYFMVVSGNTLGAHVQFMDRLHSRIQLYQVDTEEESDTIIAFVPVVSRMGTDIEAALQKIPEGRPVILVVLHHTYDVNDTVPESRRCVNIDNVIAVDCLFHEDHDGLMRCLRNDEVLKLVTDHLIDLRNSCGIPLPSAHQQTTSCFRPRAFMIFFIVPCCVCILLLTVLLIYFLVVRHNLTLGLY